MELADVLDSKSSGSDTVRVRPPLPAPWPDTARYVSYRAGVRFFFCFRPGKRTLLLSDRDNRYRPSVHGRTDGRYRYIRGWHGLPGGFRFRKGLVPGVDGSTCLPYIFLPPIPPTPFPGGEGGDYCYLLQGASPLAVPACAGARLTDCRPSGGTERCRGCCPCRSHT